MSYISLYRKYRPQVFEEVVGQVHVTRTLSNAVRENCFSHAYLFAGPRGTGKTTTARILAKALNCAEGPTPVPCNKCSLCLGVNNGSCIDVLEIDAASNRGIDEIRDLREKVNFLPVQGRYKVYIIDEAHMLTTEAFNALLKTLEEPPVHVIFVLATTEPHKVLPTILSRCQRFDFRRISVSDMLKKLKQIIKEEKIKIDEEAIPIIAKHAQGSLRDAISVLDQLSSFAGENISLADLTALLGAIDIEELFKIARIIQKKDTASSFYFIENLVMSGWDLRQFTRELINLFRDLLVVKSTGKSKLVNATPDYLAHLEELAPHFQVFELMRSIDILSQVLNEMRWATDVRLVLELALAKMTKPETDVSIEGLLYRIEELEKKSLSSKEELKVKEVKPKEKPEQKAPEAEVLAEKGLEIKRLDIDKVKRAWPVILESTKKKRIPTYSLLLECEPVEARENTLVLEFKSVAEFHKKEIEKPKNLEVVKKALKEVFGFEPDVICALKEEAKSKEKTESEKETLAPFEKEVKETSVVSLVKDSFGAEVIEEIEFTED